jgi:hypothetical protein
MKKLAITIVIICLGTLYLNAQVPPKANKTGINWAMSVKDLLTYNTDPIAYDSSYSSESKTIFATVTRRIISIEKKFWGEKFNKKYVFEDDVLLRVSIFKAEEPNFPFFDYRDYTIEFSNALTNKYGQASKTKNEDLIKDLDDLADKKFEKMKFVFVRMWKLDNETITLIFENIPYAYENIVSWSIEYTSNEIERKIEQKHETRERNIAQREEKKKRDELANVMKDL